VCCVVCRPNGRVDQGFTYASTGIVGVAVDAQPIEVPVTSLATSRPLYNRNADKPYLQPSKDAKAQMPGGKDGSTPSPRQNPSPASKENRSSPKSLLCHKPVIACSPRPLFPPGKEGGGSPRMFPPSKEGPTDSRPRLSLPPQQTYISRSHEELNTKVGSLYWLEIRTNKLKKLFISYPAQQQRRSPL